MGMDVWHRIVNDLKIAFVGIGQTYPSHVWMQRMRSMLGPQICVNIDDLRHTNRGSDLAADTRYVPRKLSRLTRMAKTMRLTRATDQRLRSEWLLSEISRSGATSVFVHFLDFATQFHDVWNRLDIPVVVHCHGYDITWDVCHHLKGTPLHPTGYRDDVRSLPENVWFIANSNYTTDRLRQLQINPDKIFLKRFGVPLADRPKEHRPNDSPNLLYLGRLVDFKGPVETVKAFHRIAAKHLDAKFHIAGGGNLASLVDETIDQVCLRDRIKCYGSVDQTQGKQLRADASIFTAHNKVGEVTGQQEAFGVAMLEAMADGVPVVTGRSGGVTDFIDHQNNGLLFTPGDIESHASMLDQLLSSAPLRREMGIAAWETVRQNYQTQHERDDLIRIFSQVMDVRGRPTLSLVTHKAA